MPTKEKKKPTFKPKTIIENTEELKASMQCANGHERCLVISEPDSSWDYRDIVPNLIPKQSIPILDSGIRTHLLGFNGEKLWPINYTPTDNEDKTPQDCYEAGCWDELEVVLSLGGRWLEKIQIGVLVGLIVGFLVVLFLIYTVASGG